MARKHIRDEGLICGGNFLKLEPDEATDDYTVVGYPIYTDGTIDEDDKYETTANLDVCVELAHILGNKMRKQDVGR